jgi:hypothetical protein
MNADEAQMAADNPEKPDSYSCLLKHRRGSNPQGFHLRPSALHLRPSAFSMI